ncbi:MAG: hypothetical protein QOI60_450 [Actinomycetota bacterium]|jgi:uncharacterized membrane protein|nr:hypothetical protein [Actinomycetota bacterium]
MFARYFVELEIEPDRVRDLLLRGPGSWLPALATAATYQGDVRLARVGFGQEVRIERTVAVELGSPVALASKTILPLRWTPTGSPGLFPTLDADLEIARLEDARTQLAMSARYAPPLGLLGRAVDRSIMFRVAEATIKDFLDRVAQALTADHDEIAAPTLH